MGYHRNARTLTMEKVSMKIEGQCGSFLLLALVVTSISSGSIQAYESGDWIIRVGVINVAPHESSDNVVLPTNPETIFPGVSVSNETKLSFMATYMLNQSFGIEVLAATPFSHDIYLEGAGIVAGDTKHLPPTVSLQWYPRGNGESIQPYLGLGLNYTAFFTEEPSQVLIGTLNTLLGANDVSLQLEDSFGAAIQAGVDIPFNDNWGLNVGVWWIDIDTTAKLKTDVGIVKFDVELDPTVYNVGVSYRF